MSSIEGQFAEPASFLVSHAFLGCLCPGYGRDLIGSPVPGVWACGLSGWYTGRLLGCPVYGLLLLCGFVSVDAPYPMI